MPIMNLAKAARTASLVVVGSGLFAGMCFLPQVRATGQTRPADGEAGTQLVGTWYGEIQLPVPGSIGLPLLNQFHADGTMVAVDASDFGGSPFSRKNGPFL